MDQCQAMPTGEPVNARGCGTSQNNRGEPQNIIEQGSSAWQRPPNVIFAATF
ncbi:MAG: hypothetical protein R3F41_05235 [Gammaproteobacteria bacterium]|nr:hypothetical protein [Pseudomonadales bacterium]MCP5345293.1 hypothetical protein [Pseudomonadales bacterium]